MTAIPQDQPRIEQEIVPVIEEEVDFHFVWTKHGRVPRFAHQTEARARAEAERLARLKPGRKFIVLASRCKLSVPADTPLEAGVEPVSDAAQRADRRAAMTILRSLRDQIDAAGGGSLNLQGYTPAEIAQALRVVVGPKPEAITAGPAADTATC